MSFWVWNLLCLLQIPTMASSKNVESSDSYDLDDIRFWNSIGRRNIEKKLQLNPHLLKVKPPKNVILFVGDGMGIATVTSARINKNQKAGIPHLNKPLYFEKFPYSGLVMTSSLDHHVTDSAASAVALFTGRKVKTRTLGILPSAKERCPNSTSYDIVDGITEGVLQKGLSVGFVTTTRITHATPAALYAKGVERHAEYDEAEVRCARDIAKQLLSYPASEFKVLMGGGSRCLMDKSRNGLRGDGRNIDLEWLRLGGSRKVLRTPSDLDQVDAANVDKLLGIFSDSHLPYYLSEKLKNRKTVPRLHEMTKKAVEVLQKDEQGFFLMVEGGTIDIAEHENWMHVTFSEMYEFEKAIQVAREMTNPNETLIIVTADHGHSFTLPGYLHAKQSILESSRVVHRGGNTVDRVENWLPTLFFAVGPGYRNGFKEHPSNAEIEQPFYRHPTPVPAPYGYHGGEDVGIWADGPLAELFSSSLENTEVAYIIKFLLCATTTDYTICDVSRSSGVTLGSADSLDGFVKIASFLASSLYSQKKDSSPQSKQMYDSSYDDEFQGLGSLG
uniref:alkaline phosphatase n=1 Tax=Haemonchus contortus TaxID=6289 RepID=A0A7I4YLK2_HAECO